MDSYTAAYIKINVHIDAGGRVHCDGKQLEVHVLSGVKKVVLPISKITYSFDELKRAGAKCDVVTLQSLALAGAEGRWKDNIQIRRENGIPSNVYIANARSIEYAIAHDKEPPPVRWIGRKQGRMTEVRDTIDEVIDDMANGNWRTEFARGRHAKRKTK